jgi:hypothetical protein
MSQGFKFVYTALLSNRQAYKVLNGHLMFCESNGHWIRSVSDLLMDCWWYK